MAILHVWKEIDLDDLDDLLPLLPLLEVGDAVVGEASDSSAVVADEDFSDLGFFLRFLPSTVVGNSMVVAAMAVMMMSGDDSFILILMILFYPYAETKERMSSSVDSFMRSP